MRAVVAYRGGDDSPEALALGRHPAPYHRRRALGRGGAATGVGPPRHRSGRPGVPRLARHGRGRGARTGGERAVARTTRRPWPSAGSTSASVATGLVQAAEETDADLLVLGSARTATEGSLARRQRQRAAAALLAGAADVGPARATPAARTRRSTADLRLRRHRPVAGGTGGGVRAGRPVRRGPAGRDIRAAGRHDVPARGRLRRRGHGRRPGGRAGHRAARRGGRDRQGGRRRQGRDGGRPAATAGTGRCSGHQLAAGDVLVFGSSRLGPLARVFLGSTASKILRHTPVPVLVIPSRHDHGLSHPGMWPS